MHQLILIQIIHIIKESRARNDIPSPINETDIPVLKKCITIRYFVRKYQNTDIINCGALIFIA